MICDKCKTEVSSTAKFCPSCGAKLGEAQPAAAQDSAEGGGAAAASEIKQAEAPAINVEKAAPSQTANAGRGASSKGPLIAVILALFVLAAAGGYLYYTGFIAKTPVKLGKQINNELKGKGLNLYCEIDKNWTATLKGSVKSPADKEAAMSIVKAHKEVKDVKDELQLRVNPSDLKLAIDNAFLVAGLMDIRADVDENLVATLQGAVSSESDKINAVTIAKGVDKVRDVKDNIQVQAAPPTETSSQTEKPLKKLKQGKKQQRAESASLDPFEIEVKINRALQNAAFKRVRARVGGQLNVFLDGRVANEARRAKAIEIARSFKGVKNVQDRMVVE